VSSNLTASARYLNKPLYLQGLIFLTIVSLCVSYKNLKQAYFFVSYLEHKRCGLKILPKALTFKADAIYKSFNTKHSNKVIKLSL